jgi:hypothetical protein
MLMGEALLARLKADAGVAAIAGARVFWDVRPQKGDLSGFPAVVLTTIFGDRPQHLDGFEDMATATVQASCYAEKKAESRALAEAVIAAAIPEGDVDDVLFWRGDASEPRDIGEQTDTGFIYHAAVDLTVRWGKNL